MSNDAWLTEDCTDDEYREALRPLSRDERTAAGVAKAMGVGRSTAAARLRALAERKELYRERDGRQLVYSIPGYPGHM